MRNLILFIFMFVGFLGYSQTFDFSCTVGGTPDAPDAGWSQTGVYGGEVTQGQEFEVNLVSSSNASTEQFITETFDIHRIDSISASGTIETYSCTDLCDGEFADGDTRQTETNAATETLVIVSTDNTRQVVNVNYEYETTVVVTDTFNESNFQIGDKNNDGDLLDSGIVTQSTTRVFDYQGNEISSTSSVEYNVTSNVAPPAVNNDFTLTDTTGSLRFSRGQAVYVTATANDPDGDSLTYNVYLNGAIYSSNNPVDGSGRLSAGFTPASNEDSITIKVVVTDGEFSHEIEHTFTVDSLTLGSSELVPTGNDSVRIDFTTSGGAILVNSSYRGVFELFNKDDEITISWRENAGRNVSFTATVSQNTTGSDTLYIKDVVFQSGRTYETYNRDLGGIINDGDITITIN